MSEVRKLEKGYRGKLSAARVKWMGDRSEAFAKATNRKGMPMTYGSGKKRES